MKKLPKITISKNIFLIIYKLLHDALLLMLLTFAAILVAEGLLPGIISAHISMARVVLAILLILAGIVWIGEKFQIVYPVTILRKNKLLPPLILLTFLLIGNSLLRFALWANFVITLTTLCIFFFFYKQLLSSHSK